MLALIFGWLFVAALIVSCVALVRSSAKRRRQMQVPADLRRADDATREPTYDNRKAYRAAQDAANWWGGPQS